MKFPETMKKNLRITKYVAGIGAILLLVTGLGLFLLASFVLFTKGITHNHILGFPIFGLQMLIGIGLGISMFLATHAIKYETEVKAVWDWMIVSARWALIPAIILNALAFIIR